MRRKITTSKPKSSDYPKELKTIGNHIRNVVLTSVYFNER